MTTTTKTKDNNLNLKGAIAELHKVYKRANSVLFNSELPEDIVIVIQSRGKRMAYGWMYTKEIWSDGKGKEMFEIGIASETLNRPYFETITTLIHEMVHVANVIRGIKDTSRGASYHNKAFKKACEEIGMEYVANEGKPDSKIGYSQVTLTKELESKIKFWGINKDSFQIARIDLFTTDGEKKKKKSNIIKLVCPCCGDIIRTTNPKVKAYCMNDEEGEKTPCGVMFEAEEQPEDDGE
jgi:hypothetical protein